MVRYSFAICACAVLMLAAAVVAGRAQPREPTAKETAAIKACVEKAEDDEAAERCISKLVAEPCIDAEGGSTYGMAGCHATEQEIWDRMLNAYYKELQEDLDAAQKAKLREMQRAWIRSRDLTCEIYHDLIKGSMAISSASACMMQETARRALLLKQFLGL